MVFFERQQPPDPGARFCCRIPIRVAAPAAPAASVTGLRKYRLTYPV